MWKTSPAEHCVYLELKLCTSNPNTCCWDCYSYSYNPHTSKKETQRHIAWQRCHSLPFNMSGISLTAFEGCYHIVENGINKFKANCSSLASIVFLRSKNWQQQCLTVQNDGMKFSCCPVFSVAYAIHLYLKGGSYCWKLKAGREMQEMCIAKERFGFR